MAMGSNFLPLVNIIIIIIIICQTLDRAIFGLLNRRLKGKYGPNATGLSLCLSGSTFLLNVGKKLTAKEVKVAPRCKLDWIDKNVSVHNVTLINN